MKQQQPIARQSAKPKRGHEFIDDNTGQLVFLYRVKSDVCYLVSTSKEYLPGDLYDAKPSDLSASRPIRQSSISLKPKALTAEEKARKASLNVFFASQMVGMPFLCSECNSPLRAFSNYQKRCCIAHILPKSTFPSVATHPQNVIHLGSTFAGSECSHHSNYDEMGAEYRSKMNCYPIVLERFEQFKHLLTAKELVSAYSYLGLTWE